MILLNCMTSAQKIQSFGRKNSESTKLHSASLISRYYGTSLDGRRILKGNLKSQCQNHGKVYKNVCPLFLGEIPRNHCGTFPSI